MGERVGQLGDDADGFLPGGTPVFQPVVERTTLDVFRDNVATAVLHTHVEDGDDARMPKLGQPSRLGDGLLCLGPSERAVRYLDRHLAAQLFVETDEDDAKTATAQFAEDAITAKGGGPGASSGGMSLLRFV